MTALKEFPLTRDPIIHDLAADSDVDRSGIVRFLENSDGVVDRTNLVKEKGAVSKWLRGEMREYGMNTAMYLAGERDKVMFFKGPQEGLLHRQS